ncbi:MAG TPA: oligosaccharide flippase family protein [Aliidongia sp.]|nr:oligosaccharide flippase family protein [Aliidongia sp.]
MSPSLWVAVEKLSQQAVWLVLFAILAPILGPRPYGLFAIVMVFIGFCEFVTVEAACEALIGMEPLEPLHLKTATACNLAISIAAGIGVFLLAPLFGRLFEDPDLVLLFEVLSVLPALSALTSAPIAVLKRRMDFRPLALRATLSLVIGGVAGVAFAFAGAGVWSLVTQILLQRVSEVVILWVTTGGSGLGWSRPHYHDLRSYAAHVFISRSMLFLSAQFPRLIIGYFLGPVDLGLFTLASRFPETLAQIVLTPKMIVARVDLRRYRYGEEALGNSYYRLLRDIALIGFPMSLGAAATIPLLISVWLDERWQAGILASQLMFLTVPPQVFFHGASVVLLALNFPREEARLSTIQSLSNVLFVLVAVPFGLNAVCLFMVLRVFLLMPYPAILVSRVCGIPKRGMAEATGSPFGLSLAMAVAVAAISPLLVRMVGYGPAFAGLIVIGCVLYGVLLGIFAPDEARRFISRLPFAS